jgi:hypothetical protein
MTLQISSTGIGRRKIDQKLKHSMMFWPQSQPSQGKNTSD